MTEDTDLRNNKDVLTRLVEQQMLECEATETEYRGYIEGEDNFQKFFNLLNAAGYYYYRRGKRLGTNSSFYFNIKGRDLDVPFFGPAFTLQEATHYRCVNGDDDHKNSKRAAAERVVDDNLGPKRRKITTTTKIGCKAKMLVKRVRVYPDYIADTESRHDRRQVSKLLKQDLNANKNVKSCLRYYICLSTPSEHSHPISSAIQAAVLHPRLVTEIHNLVKRNVSTVDSVREHLRAFVERLFADSDIKPDPMNRGFYPTHRTTYNHISAAMLKRRRSVIDQEGLCTAIDRWKSSSPEDHFFFRPYRDPATSEEASTFIFCCQTKWQQQLLARYGNYICLLDQVTITTFFLIVKTNIDYCVVGIFAVQNDTEQALQEALQVFTSWNLQWKPRFFITDFSEVQISAVESVFPEAKVYMSVFHREKAWSQWFAKNSGCEDLKELWQNLARASSEDKFQECLEDLYKSDSWKKCKKAREYFLSQWLTAAHRWADAFWDPEFLSVVRMNNGVDTQTKVWENSFVNDLVDQTFTEMLSVLIEKYLPESLRKYSMFNGKVSPDFELNNSSIPSYLMNRPYCFVKHVMDRLSIAESFMGKISHISDGMFLVQGEEDKGTFHTVSFNPVHCTCEDFSTWVFPCMHFCIIFLFVSGWSFPQLAEEYKESPFLTLDADLGLVHAIFTKESSALGVEDFAEAIDNSSKESILQAQESLREEVDKLMRLSYFCVDVDCLEKARKSLQHVASEIRASASSSYGNVREEITSTLVDYEGGDIKRRKVCNDQND